MIADFCILQGYLIFTENSKIHDFGKIPGKQNYVCAVYEKSEENLTVCQVFKFNRVEKLKRLKQKHK